MIPLAGIGRDERFPDPVEQDKLQALSDKIDEATAFSDGDHRVVQYTQAPKGVAGAELDTGQREVLRLLLDTYFGRVPAEVSPLARSHRRLWPRRARPPPRHAPALTTSPTGLLLAHDGHLRIGGALLAASATPSALTYGLAVLSRQIRTSRPGHQSTASPNCCQDNPLTSRSATIWAVFLSPVMRNGRRPGQSPPRESSVKPWPRLFS